MDADIQAIIWNRAATAGGGPAPRPGDSALSAALRLHSMIVSGGLDHALDILTPEDFASAAAGFRYLRLSHVADLVEQAQDSASDDHLEELDARYGALIPRDQVISDQLQTILQQPTSRRLRTRGRNEERFTAGQQGVVVNRDETDEAARNRRARQSVQLTCGLPGT